MGARFTNHNKKAVTYGFTLPKLPGQEGVQRKLEEVFGSYEPLLTPFTVEQAKGKIEVWSCMWEEKDRLDKTVFRTAVIETH